MDIIKNKQEILNLTDNDLKNLFRYNRSVNKDYTPFLGFSKMTKQEAQNLLMDIYNKGIVIYKKNNI